MKQKVNETKDLNILIKIILRQPLKEYLILKNI
jgi:hypothetical protein